MQPFELAEPETLREAIALLDADGRAALCPAAPLSC